MVSAQATASRPASNRASGSSSGILSFLLSAILWLFLSLLISILIEWIGMTWWWPEEGTQHSIDMYERELGHLGGDLHQSMLVSDPAGLAVTFAGYVQSLWERSGLLDLVVWMAVPPSPDDRFRQIIHGLHGYAAATVFITMVFAVRVAILILAMPIFALFALVALVDGLVERDLRRFSAGRESAYIFHLAKAATTPMLILAWTIYLSMPFSIHPAIVILPFAGLFALFIRITASSFKKYL